MTTGIISEAPLETPDQDVLNFAIHARRLAEILGEAELPFTVGIYGPWGAGKTSFANLLQFELRKRPEWSNAQYVNFSAWPYVTSDVIWQALVERIARAICKQDPSVPSHLDPRDYDSWTSRLRRALLSDALTLRSAEADPAKERYERLVRRLNIAAGVASRTASDRVSGLTIGRAAALFLDSASALAPSAGPLRKLLTGDGSTKGLIPSDKVAPVLVKTIEDIRSDLQDLLTIAPDERLIVLIDDLDRCLPEVALDVLETVKIFFSESVDRKSKCLFLVAADERLIARGLQARLGAEVGFDQATEARAYLEKIVQLGIALPEVGSRHSRALVRTWAPSWTCAADLIATALEDNPRRIKQYSTVLSYNFAARNSDTLDGDTANAMLAKLVRLNMINPNISKHVRAILHRPDYQELLRSHEVSGVDEQDAGQTSRLRLLLARHSNARRIFKRAPLFSTYDRSELDILISLADVEIGRDGSPISKNPKIGYGAVIK